MFVMYLQGEEAGELLFQENVTIYTAGELQVAKVGW